MHTIKSHYHIFYKVNNNFRSLDHVLRISYLVFRLLRTRGMASSSSAITWMVADLSWNDSDVFDRAFTTSSSKCRKARLLRSFSTFNSPVALFPATFEPA